MCSFFFFFNDTAPTEIYTLSLHDALPIWCSRKFARGYGGALRSHPARRSHHIDDHQLTRGYHLGHVSGGGRKARCGLRSEEHTSELQSQSNLVCRLLLEKKNKELAAAVAI